MKKEIVINATTNDIRVAILEDERLAEVFLEVADKESRIGAIYLGKVQRIVQGMNAAFVDIGEQQHAFLHFSDVGNAVDDEEREDEDDDTEDGDEPTNGLPIEPVERPKGRGERRTDRRGKGRVAQEAPAADTIHSSEPPEPLVKPTAAAEESARAPAGRERGKGERKPDRKKGEREKRPKGRRGDRTEPAAEPETAPGVVSAHEQPPLDLPEVPDFDLDVEAVDQAPRPDEAEESAEAAAQRKRRRRRGRRGRGRRGDRPETGEGGPRQEEPAVRESFEAAHEETSRETTDESAAQPAGAQESGGAEHEEQRRRRSRRRGGRRNRRRGGREHGDEGQQPADSPAPHGETERPDRERHPERPDGSHGDHRHDDRRHGERHRDEHRPGDRRHDDRPRDDRSGEGRFRDERKQEDRPRDERKQEDRPRDERKHDERRHDARPREEGRREGGARDEPRRDEPRPERRERDDRRRDGRRHQERRDHDRAEGSHQKEERVESRREDDRPIPTHPPEFGPAEAHDRGERGAETGRGNRRGDGRRGKERRIEENAGETSVERPQIAKEPAPKKRPARASKRTGIEKEREAPPAHTAVAETRSPDIRTEPAAAAPDSPKKSPRRSPRKGATPKSAEAPTATAVETPPAPEGDKAAPRRPARKASTRKTPPRKGGTMDAKLPTFQTKRSGEVTIALERNQEIIVQVTRESYSQKGVRVTTKVSLPGRFLVLLPLDASVGVSRKVQSTKERRRLRRVARSILPEGYGCIIRTNAQNKDADLIRQDLVKLIENWRTIEEKLKARKGPGLLYRDQSVANTVMRDLFTPDISRVVIDNRTLHRQIRDYVEWAAPGLADKIELYSGDAPVFDHYRVEQELEKMFQRRIYLPSGGYIILDQTEAMMVIDVNSGRYADRSEQEITSLRTNIEAAREIARQIRLRDIGGLLVVDFIDLYHETNRKKVYDELKKEMRRDRAKSVVLSMTQFGLVQMTRQRVRQQVLATMSEPCPTCDGSGMVQSKSTVLRQIERWLQRFRSNCREFRLMFRANPGIIDFLTEPGEDGVSKLARLMMRNFVRLKIVPDETLAVNEFHFYSVRHQTDITDKYRAEKHAA